MKQDEEYAQQFDARIKPRLTYMFNTLDFDNDRYRAKQRFLN